MAHELRTRRPSLRRSWSPEEDAALLEMLHQGKSLGSVAVKFKRSLAAIYRRKAMLERGALSGEIPRSIETLYGCFGQ
jgi:hypothetical protein